MSQPDSSARPQDSSNTIPGGLPQLTAQERIAIDVHLWMRFKQGLAIVTTLNVLAIGGAFLAVKEIAITEARRIVAEDERLRDVRNQSFQDLIAATKRLGELKSQLDDRADESERQSKEIDRIANAIKTTKDDPVFKIISDARSLSKSENSNIVSQTKAAIDAVRVLQEELRTTIPEPYKLRANIIAPIKNDLVIELTKNRTLTLGAAGHINIEGTEKEKPQDVFFYGVPVKTRQ